VQIPTFAIIVTIDCEGEASLPIKSFNNYAPGICSPIAAADAHLSQSGYEQESVVC
jgi:hypothetical protein